MKPVSSSTSERISFDRILCPIDLTSDSEEALRYGIALARAYNAKLFVLHCKNDSKGEAVSDNGSIKKALDNFVKKNLFLPTGEPLDWEDVIVEGEAADAITRMAAEHRIDLIVMRSRRRPYAAALLGSTAESICRAAPCPILVTHQGEADWAGKSTNDIGLQHVLVAYDSSSDSELALSYGLSLAQEYQAVLHLLHVLPSRIRQQAPEIALLPLSAEIAFDEAASRLQSAVPTESRLWCEIRHAVSEGHPYREILAYAEEHEIDLICMGASGTGFGMKALFGSNSDRVLRQAPCPVLIARPLRPMVATTAIANY